MTETEQKCRVCYGQMYQNAGHALCPHEDERVVLSIMLVRPGLHKTVRKVLAEKDFDIEEHRAIYASLLDLFKGGILSRHKRSGPVSVVDLNMQLREKGKHGLLRYLTILSLNAPPAVFAPEPSPVSATDVARCYAYIVKRKSLERQLRQPGLTSQEKNRVLSELSAVKDNLARTRTYGLLPDEGD